MRRAAAQGEAGCGRIVSRSAPVHRGARSTRDGGFRCAVAAAASSACRRTDRRPGSASIRACAPCRHSGRAGSASGARGARNGAGVTFSSFSSTASGVLPRRQAGAVADAEDVRVDRDRLRAERDVHHHVGGLAADAGQRLQRVAVGRHLAAMLGDQRAADRAMTFFALVLNRPIVLMCSLQRRPRRARPSAAGVSTSANSARGRLVDADVGRLRRQRDRDEQRVGVDIVELGLGRGVRPRPAGGRIRTTSAFFMRSAARARRVIA